MTQYIKFFKFFGLINDTCWIDWNKLEFVKVHGIVRAAEAVLGPDKPGCLFAGPALTDWQGGRQAGRQAGSQAGRRDPGGGEGRLLILLSKVNIQRSGTWHDSLRWLCVAPGGLTSVRVWQLTSSTGIKVADFINCSHSWRCNLPRDAPLRMACAGSFWMCLLSDFPHPMAFWKIAKFYLILTQSWLCLFAVLGRCCAVGITLSSWWNYSLTSKSPCSSPREKQWLVKRLLAVWHRALVAGA